MTTSLITGRNEYYESTISTIFSFNKRSLTFDQFALCFSTDPETLFFQLINTTKASALNFCNDLDNRSNRKRRFQNYFSDYRSYVLAGKNLDFYLANQNFHSDYKHSLTENGKKLNLSGHRFYNYFLNNYLNSIVENYRQALGLLTYIQATIKYFNSPHALNSKFKIISESFITSLDPIFEALGRVSLYHYFNEQMRPIKEDILSHLTTLISNLLRHYQQGDIHPGSITTQMRPFLCSLLQIHDVPIVLTTSKAHKLDEKIITKIKTIDSSYRFRFIESRLIIMEPITQLPNMLNVPLTTKLLIQFVSYWYTTLNFLSNVPYLREKDHLPPLIAELIRLINNQDADITQRFNKKKLAGLKHLLKLDSKASIELMTDSNPLSKIYTALMLSKDFAGELKTTELSFSQLQKLLRGEQIDTLKQKTKEKVEISQEEFDKRVEQEFLKQGNDASIIAIRQELQKKYNLPGKKTSIKATDFEALVAQKAAELKNPNLNDIRQQLHRVYEIDLSLNQDEDMSFISSYRSQHLQRTGIHTFQLFGSTSLDRLLGKLKKRHEKGDDRLDEYDVKQIQLHLAERWNRLCLAEGGPDQAARAHYLNPSSEYQDHSHYIMAYILAKYFRKQGQLIFSYELLMPNYFLPANQLKVLISPSDPTGENPESSLTLEEMMGITLEDLDDYSTIDDDIRIPSLVTTRSGFALDINWILTAYTKERSLINPYTKATFTKKEIDDIFRHPLAEMLGNQVFNNCVPHLTERAFNIFHEYVKGTVFGDGFTGYYGPIEQAKATAAEGTYYEKLKELPTREKEALEKEMIPGSSVTVSDVFKTREGCITQRNGNFVKLIVAYRPHDHGFNDTVLDYSGARNIPVKEFVNPRNAIQINGSELEDYIIKKMAAIDTPNESNSLSRC